MKISCKRLEHEGHLLTDMIRESIRCTNGSVLGPGFLYIVVLPLNLEGKILVISISLA